MHKNWKLALVGVIGIYAGFNLCILVKKFSTLKVDPVIGFEINPFEIFSMVVTVILAIYVARTIAKRNDLEKNEKDLLIKYLEDFKVEFNLKVNALLEMEEPEPPNTNSNLKIIRMKMDSIIALSIQYNFIDSTEETTKELSNKIRDIWEYFTDTPRRPQGAEFKQDVASNIHYIKLEQKNKIEKAVIEVEKNLFILAMKINRK